MGSEMCIRDSPTRVAREPDATHECIPASISKGAQTLAACKENAHKTGLNLESPNLRCDIELCKMGQKRAAPAMPTCTAPLGRSPKQYERCVNSLLVPARSSSSLTTNRPV